MKKYIIILTIFLSLSANKALSESLKGKLWIGLGYPYISLKYGTTYNSLIEGRFAFSEKIKVFGGRFYYLFNPEDIAILQLGGEVDYVSFKDEIEGDGYIFYIFCGLKYFITENLTFNMDIGPAYVNLKEKEFKLTISEVDWLFNLGIGLYLKGLLELF